MELDMYVTGQASSTNYTACDIKFANFFLNKIPMRCNSTGTFYLLAVYLFIRVSSFIDSGKLHGHRYNEHFAKRWFKDTQAC